MDYNEMARMVDRMMQQQSENPTEKRDDSPAKPAEYQSRAEWELTIKLSRDAKRCRLE